MIRSSPVLMPQIIMGKDAAKGLVSQTTNFGALLAGISSPATPVLARPAAAIESLVSGGEDSDSASPSAVALVVDANTGEAAVPPILPESVPVLDSDAAEPVPPVVAGQVDAVSPETAINLEVLSRSETLQTAAHPEDGTETELAPETLAAIALVSPGALVPPVESVQPTQPVAAPVKTAPASIAPTATTTDTAADPTVVIETIPNSVGKVGPQAIAADGPATDEAPQLSIPAAAPSASQIHDIRPTPELKEVKAPEPAAIKMIQEQLRGQIVRMVSDEHGNKLIKVRLHPEELGSVTVKATFESTGVRIELIPATETAREAIKVAIQDLRRDLLAHNSDASLDLGEERSGENPKEPHTSQHHVETQSETHAPALRVTDAGEPDQFDRSV